MIKLKIKVTKDILRKSKRCGKNKKTDDLQETNCAIALAVRDIFPRAYVDGDSVFFDSAIIKTWLCPTLQGILPASALPEIAKNFICDFDFNSPYKRAKMNPIEFEIEVPDSVIEKINLDELRPVLENHPTLELMPS